MEVLDAELELFDVFASVFFVWEAFEGSMPLLSGSYTYWEGRFPVDLDSPVVNMIGCMCISSNGA